MTSFVEAENERRAKDRSKSLVPAELITDSVTSSIYVIDLRKRSCSAIITSESLPESVRLKLALPQRGKITLQAKVTAIRELGSQRSHVSFGQFEFESKADENSLLSFVNEVLVDSEDLGVKALRSLGSEELRRLSRFVKASRTLNPCQGYIEALEQVVEVTRRALGAERGLFLVDRGPDEIAVEVARGSAALQERGLRFSKTVTQKVAESGQPLLSLDAQTDSNLGQVMSIKMMGTVSVMCVPLATKDRRFGYLYLDNSMSKGIFRETDLALATIIADLAAACLEKNWQHLVALQGERVNSAKGLLASLSRDLLPTLSLLEQTAQRLPGEIVESSQIQAKLRESLQLLREMIPDSGGRRTKQRVDLMEMLEELTLDFEEVDIPLPPEEGWPQLALDLTQLYEVVAQVVRGAKPKQDSPVILKAFVSNQFMKLTILSETLEMSGLDLSRVFHPFRGRGLSDAQRIVHENRGLLKVHKSPEKGTVFTLEFPLSKE